MVFFGLNDIVSFVKGTYNSFQQKSTENRTSTYYFFKYDPYINDMPFVQTWYLHNTNSLPMMLDNLFLFKNLKDETYSFRRSCREGICGSCAMNINGVNTLACLYHVNTRAFSSFYVFPLPHMPIIKDLIVCMKSFYEQYKSINPFLQVKSLLSINSINTTNSNFSYSNIELISSLPISENLQSKEERLLLDGLYECILCACCSTSCPSYWWNRDKYLGPAVLLQSYRWVIDSRDDFISDRLAYLNDLYRLYRCHTILNCVQVCPKKLSPAKAISNIKTLLLF